ncbi:hypothetical protein [Brucella cytisi]|uniref:hypothetical protein n=1 Tax=Brucella cytisi TaxID=407152 RepID=UPI00313C3EF2
MARAEMKTTARKGRRMEARSETDKPVVNKSEGALNVALAAGALGLGIAMLEQQKAAAANADLPETRSKESDQKTSAFPTTNNTAQTSDQASADSGAHREGGTTSPVTVSHDHVAAPVETVVSHEGIKQGPDITSANQNVGTANTATDLEVSEAVTKSHDQQLEGSAHSTVTESDIDVSVDAATSPVIAGPAHVVSVTQVLDAPAAVLDTVGEVATDLLGSDSLLGSNGVLGIIPAVAGTVSTALGNDNPLSSILGDGTDGLASDLASNGDKILDSVAGESGILDNVADTGANVVAQLVDVGGVLAGGLGTAVLSADETTSSSNESGGSTAEPAASNVDSDPTDTVAAIGSNMFEVANAAMQITESVADAITPILKFVGQPFIDTDAHTDGDHSHNNAGHHSV